MIRLSALFAVVGFACGGSSVPEPVAPEPVTPEPVAEPVAEPAPPAEPPAEPEPPPPPPPPTMKLVTVDQVQFQPMVPEAGDQGPVFGVLWGDPATGPSGLLVRAPAKFATPPHVHSSDYRGVVVSGSVHNDVPKAKRPAELPVGSSWTQPGGQVHITGCKPGCLAYIEVDGPFDSHPADKAGPSPGGMKAGNTPAKKLKWVPMMPDLGKKGPMLAQVWGDPKTGPNGFFIKIPAGFPGGMHTHTSAYHAVVLQGQAKHWEPNQSDVKANGPGTYFWQDGGAVHQDSCEPGQDCLAYVHMMGPTDFAPAAP